MQPVHYFILRLQYHVTFIWHRTNSDTYDMKATTRHETIPDFPTRNGVPGDYRLQDTTPPY